MRKLSDHVHLAADTDISEGSNRIFYIRVTSPSDITLQQSDIAHIPDPYHQSYHRLPASLTARSCNRAGRYQSMSTNPSHNVWDTQPSLTASMEDFESHGLSRQLSRTQSRSHLQFRSPEASQYSDVTDMHGRDSWSPPAWRKAGSGWFRHHQGLASPMRSREGSPEKDDEVAGRGDYEDLTTAAEIPLPGSPVKGRSISRSASPAKMLATPEAELKPAPKRKNRRQETPETRSESPNNCRSTGSPRGESLLANNYRHSFFGTSRCTTSNATDRRSSIVFSPWLQESYEI